MDCYCNKCSINDDTNKYAYSIGYNFSFHKFECLISANILINCFQIVTLAKFNYKKLRKMNEIVQKNVILWQILSFKNYNCINN